MKTRLQSILLLRDDKQQEVTNDYLGEERHKLREDCFAFIHGLQELALMPFRKLANSNRKIIFAL